VQTLQPWAPVIAAAIAAAIAITFGFIQASVSRQQAKTAAAAAATAKSKLKLDLFEKRLEVFTVTKNAIDIAWKSRDFPTSNDKVFLSGTSGARWLFNEQIADYIQRDIWGRLVDIHLKNTISTESDSMDERNQARTERNELSKQLIKDLHKLEELLAPFLQIEG